MEAVLQIPAQEVKVEGLTDAAVQTSFNWFVLESKASQSLLSLLVPVQAVGVSVGDSVGVRKLVSLGVGVCVCVM